MALSAVQSNWPELKTFDFGRLEGRARDQHEIAEKLRLDSARRVLSGREG